MLQNAWRSRQNASLMLDHVDQFFRECIGAGPKSGVSLQVRFCVSHADDLGVTAGIQLLASAASQGLTACSLGACLLSGHLLVSSRAKQIDPNRMDLFALLRSCLRNLESREISVSLQGNVPVQEQDLERPFHSNKAHMLLAANTSGGNMSFNPY